MPGGRLRAAVEDLRCSGHTRERARGRTRLGKASSTVPESESGISTHKSRAQAARPRSPAGLPGEGLAMPKHSCRGWKTGMFLPMGRYEHQVTKSMKTRGEMTKTRGPRKAPETNYKNEMHELTDEDDNISFTNMFSNEKAGPAVGQPQALPPLGGAASLCHELIAFCEKPSKEFLHPRGTQSQPPKEDAGPLLPAPLPQAWRE